MDSSRARRPAISQRSRQTFRAIPSSQADSTQRHDAAAQAPHRVEERGLDGILGVLAAAELRQAEAEDPAGVAPVERLFEAGVEAEPERLETGGATR